MSCCKCYGIESKFDQKKAARDLEKYREKGLEESTRILIDALKAEGISGMTLLDIGGGVGVIQHEMLNAGVSSCVNVEASRAYIEAAEKEAKRQNHTEHIEHVHGDFVELAPDIPQQNIVTLDKVICCYHDILGLVGLSSMRATRMYGLVYPRDNWWIKLVTVFQNLYYRIQRNPFRLFMHPTEVVEEIVLANGFKRRFYRGVGMWQVVVYERK